MRKANGGGKLPIAASLAAAKVTPPHPLAAPPLHGFSWESSQPCWDDWRVLVQGKFRKPLSSCFIRHLGILGIPSHFACV
mmetsp:Transcript_21976/g.41381  ORF Transcript_21976/g.41381 Transcript_21976/m.41381 type:complete len:80 (-) Transcript_21976:34-273(-)